MKKIKKDIGFYIDKLKSNESFTFVKYGDGEFGTIFSPGLKNQENCVYHPRIGRRMKSAILHRYQDNFIYAFGAISNRVYKHDIEKFLKEYDLEDMVWGDADDFHIASLQQAFYPMVEQLNKMNLLYVGPEFIRKLSRYVNYNYYVEVPRVDAALKEEAITNNILEVYNSDKSIDVIGFSAGFATNLCVDRLWPEIGQEVSMIDFGSIFDPACGNVSRGYMRKLDRASLMKNFVG